MAAHAKELGAGPLLGADGLEPLHAARENVRQVTESFNVVDHGGAAEEALHRGKRGLDLGEPALSLEGAEEARLFTANVRSRAPVHGEVAAELRAQDIFPQKAPRIG